MRRVGMRCALVPLVLCIACAPAGLRREEPTSESIDVDALDRGQTVHVALGAWSGTLFVRNGTLDEDPEDGEPWECDTRAHATWEAGTTVLAARTDVASDDGTPGGWIGTVLPWGDGVAMAVRSWTVGWGERGIGERDDELVTIGLPEITVAPVYVPGGRLRAMGIVRGHAILLVSSRDGTHHVVAVDRSGHEVARTEAITPSPDIVGALTQPTEYGLPYAAPIDAATIALVCAEDGALCTVNFDGTALTLVHTDVTIGDGLSLTEEGAFVAHGDDCRTLLDPTLAPCVEPIASSWVDGLPVDGVLASEIEGDVSRSDARFVVVLDPRAPETEEEGLARAHAGVLFLEGPGGGATDVTFDLLVRGDHLAISYTRVDGTQAMTVRRDLALALPLGRVEATRTEEGVRVRIHTTFPIHYSHDCWQGFWVVRAWYEGAGEAFTNTYAEYGYCD